MNRDELLQRISVDPNVCFGRPCIRGTRVWVSLIVENLADGMREEELLAEWPQLTPDDVRASLHYAAMMTSERSIPLGAIEEALIVSPRDPRLPARFLI